jgi:hypothetical protein
MPCFLLAQEVMPMLEEEARKRQMRIPESVREKFPTQNKGRPSEHAGKLFDVNEKYILLFFSALYSYCIITSLR